MFNLFGAFLTCCKVVSILSCPKIKNIRLGADYAVSPIGRHGYDKESSPISRHFYFI